MDKHDKSTLIYAACLLGFGYLALCTTDMILSGAGTWLFMLTLLARGSGLFK